MEFIGVSYQNRYVYMPKPADWKQMLDKVSQTFSLNPDQISQLRVNYQPHIHVHQFWELGPEAWEGVKDGSSVHLELPRVHEKPCHLRRDQRVSTMMELSDFSSDLEVFDAVTPGEPITIVLTVSTGPHYRIHTTLSATVKQLKDLYHDETGIPLYQQQLVFRGCILPGDMRLDECGITDGAVVHCMVPSGQ
ncbi:hypothetical protein PGQ11_009623 [Apiospora arundinis]|uniref:Ubiquitin-like domain-containing protein n=1 Tax=Apiospora arundinis TaxID=335852 RepID=A0ABR2III7_9PEZI